MSGWVSLRTLLTFFFSFVGMETCGDLWRLPGTLEWPLKVGFGFGVVCMVVGFFKNVTNVLSFFCRNRDLWRLPGTLEWSLKVGFGCDVWVGFC